MKKISLILGSLMLWLFIQPATAQASLETLDSTVLANATVPSAIDTSQAKNRKEQAADDLTIRRIAVKAGDLITVSATVLDNAPYKNRLWKSLAKAVAPAFVLGNLNKQQADGSTEQQTGGGNLPTVGANLTIMPGALELSKISRSKTFVGLASYDSAGRQIAVVTNFMTKAARKDWEQLKVSYKVEQDGFVEVLGNQDNTKEISVETQGYDNWISVSKQSDSKTVSSNSVKSPLGGISPISDSAQTSSGNNCIAWYWCTAWGCQFIGIECSIDHGDYYPNSGGVEGGGAVSEQTKQELCEKCKQDAQREHDTGLIAAKNVLITAVVGGCSYAAAGVFVEVNAVGAWAHLIPGIGSATVELLASLGALIVDISCVVTSISVYESVEASIKGSYNRNMRDCEEKYCR